MIFCNIYSYSIYVNVRLIYWFLELRFYECCNSFSISSFLFKYKCISFVHSCFHMFSFSTTHPPYFSIKRGGFFSNIYWTKPDQRLASKHIFIKNLVCGSLPTWGIPHFIFAGTEVELRRPYVALCVHMYVRLYVCQSLISMKCYYLTAIVPRL